MSNIYKILLKIMLNFDDILIFFNINQLRKLYDRLPFVDAAVTQETISCLRPVSIEVTKMINISKVPT